MKAQKPLLKYELTNEMVGFLLECLNVTSVRGTAGATQMLNTVSILRSPLNLKELQAVEAEDAALENKAKEIPTEGDKPSVEKVKK